MADKYQYQIVKNTTDPGNTFEVGGRAVKLAKNGSTYVFDPALAKDLDARYGHKAKGKDGGKLVVIEVDDRDPTKESGHQNTFSMPDMSRIKYRTVAERMNAEREAARQ